MMLEIQQIPSSQHIFTTDTGPRVRGPRVRGQLGHVQHDHAISGGREVVINRYAGEAVLRGAHVYSPGLLAASGGLSAGDMVGVSVACEQPDRRWCGIPRGLRLQSQGGGSVDSNPGDSGPHALRKAPSSTATAGLQLPVLPSRSHLFVGIGRCVEGRRAMFRRQIGLAVEMVERVYETPSMNGLWGTWGVKKRNPVHSDRFPMHIPLWIAHGTYGSNSYQ